MSILDNISGSNFHDVLPEINSVPVQRGINSTDPTLLPEIEAAIVNGAKTDISVRYANFIRTKQRGSEVRESIARFGLWLDVRINQVEDIEHKISNDYESILQQIEDFNKKYDQAVNAQTIDGEVKIARISAINGITYNSLKERLDAMDSRLYTMKAGSLTFTRILETTNLKTSYGASVVSTVANPNTDYPLIISDIGPTKRFSFVKGGSV